MKNIIFIGDSFCSSMSQEHYEENGSRGGQGWAWKTETHPSIVANAFNAELKNYGFAAKSWWYSYSQFNEEKIKVLREYTVAIVFFHTNPIRINSSNPKWSIGETNMCEPYRYLSKEWVTYMLDEEFQKWAQQRYFSELKELYNDIKTIHFNCFSDSAAYCNLLPGMVFQTPLYTISLSEETANFDDDKRKNHFNPANNIALAQLIIDSINNYAPGKYDIDTSKFDLKKSKITTPALTPKIQELIHPAKEVIKDYTTIMKEKGFFK
jgi:hypothetical protein